MLQIIALVIGIVGLVMRRVSISKDKELRGVGLWVVCLLFILPLPLAFLAGFIFAASSGGAVGPDDEERLNTGVTAISLVALIGGLVCAYSLAKPKLPLNR